MTDKFFETWLRPDFVIHSSLEEMAEQYASAREAFSSGNYELAATIALKEGDNRTAALSIIMCGGLKTGLCHLDSLTASDPETNLTRAFALWTLERSDEALSLLKSINRGKWSVPAVELTRLINSPELRILVVHSSDSYATAPIEAGPGFAITLLSKDDILEGRIPNGNLGYDLILCMQTFPPRLRDYLDRFKGPVVSAVADFDMNIPQHSQVFSSSRYLLAGTSSEHHKLGQIYGKRVAAFLGRYNARTHPNNSQSEQGRYDLTFSGRAFSSYWPDKARFLFRVATIDEPELEIRIIDGFLPKTEYQQLLASSRYNLQPQRFGFSLMQGRTADALWQGSGIVSYGPVRPQDYLPGLKDLVQIVNENDLEQKLRDLLLTTPKPRSSEPEILDDIFSEQPSYDVRILKYTLFQLILAGNGQINDAQKRVNNNDVKTRQAFEAFSADPLNTVVRDATLTQFNTAYQEEPNRIMPAFNYARFLWNLEQKERAVEVFEELEKVIPTGDLDPQTDDPLSHLVHAFSDMMPYQEYYLAVIQDLTGGSGVCSRQVIMSTVKSYLGLNLAQSDDLEGSLTLMKDALESLPKNGPAARLLAKAMFAHAKPADEVWKAIESAVLIYPPFLTELLPFALETLEKLGRIKHAQNLTRQWAYFITRVEWRNPTKHPIPDQTWLAATTYSSAFPNPLKRKFEDLKGLAQ